MYSAVHNAYWNGCYDNNGEIRDVQNQLLTKKIRDKETIVEELAEHWQNLHLKDSTIVCTTVTYHYPSQKDSVPKDSIC